jgi:DNA-binding MarR family transcriptional regulator
MTDSDLTDDERRVLEALSLSPGAPWTDKTVLSIAKKSKLTTKEVSRVLQNLAAMEYVQCVEDTKVGDYWQLRIEGSEALEAQS